MPTLVMITLLTFFISLSAPGDPVLRLLNKGSYDVEESQIETSEAYLLKQKEVHLDLPVFYWTVSSDNPYIPSFRWNGLESQYHYWIQDLFSGMGVSYVDKQIVFEKIKEALSWTIILSILSLFLSYLIAIPIGVYLAVNATKWSSDFIQVLLYILYSIPSFWLITVLFTFFANPDYFVWFDPLGFNDLAYTEDFGEQWKIFTKHMWVPLTCMTYASLAFLVKHIRSSMLEVLDEEFIRSANAKGLQKHVVIWKHAFKNALFPLITIAAQIFPYLMGGALIVEILFSIPGIGKLSLDAIMSRDYPVVLGVTMLTAILTLIGYLLADVFYSIFDPRIRFNK